MFQAPNTGIGLVDDYEQIVDTPGVDAISTSWGECESESGSALPNLEASIFQQAATEGISVYAAAGDDGSSDCYKADNSSARPWTAPGSQPYVTGTGGTSLPVDPPPARPRGTTPALTRALGAVASPLYGRCPAIRARPSGLGVINNLSSGSSCGVTGQYCREVPDVSADADPQTGYLIYWRGGWIPIGGTSAVAPLWAAYTELVNASPACNGTPIGFANPLLYTAAASTTQATSPT